MGESRGTLRRQLPPHPASAGEARRMVRRLLGDAGRCDLLDAGQLLVSELVTNALVHSGTQIDVCLTVTDDSLRVEVGDGRLRHPRPRRYTAPTGKGLGFALLEKTADAWGALPSIRGQTVWFVLVSRSRGDAEECAHLDADAPRGD